MTNILQQLRRSTLKLKQHDMLMRVGMSRQQYQRLESKGNPRLSTLELIAKGLKSSFVLIPDEKLTEVKSLLVESETKNAKPLAQNSPSQEEPEKNPWSQWFQEKE